MWEYCTSDTTGDKGILLWFGVSMNISVDFLEDLKVLKIGSENVNRMDISSGIHRHPLTKVLE